MPEDRLQKILAHAGVASRRKAEELILAGRVSVNGKTVTELGSKADLAADKVKVDGQILSEPKHHVYFAFNKPKNTISTVKDPQGRQTVMSFFKGLRERIYPVGRLDYASEGLLLLTNDGEFANHLMSPASHVTKTYLVKVNGALTPEQEEEFRRGIPMHGRRTAPAGLKLLRKTVNPWYEVRLVEGRQNQVRIMFKHFNRLVEKLKRVKIGFLDLGILKPGAYRTLTNLEVARFQKLMNMDGGESKPAGTKEASEPGQQAPEKKVRGARPEGGGPGTERNWRRPRVKREGRPAGMEPARQQRSAMPGRREPDAKRESRPAGMEPARRQRGVMPGRREPDAKRESRPAGMEPDSRQRGAMPGRREPDATRESGRPASRNPYNNPSGGDRDNRPASASRDNKPGSASRDDRRASGNRDDRRASGNRDNKPAGASRDNRRSSMNRSKRPAGGSRDGRRASMDSDERPRTDRTPPVG